MDWRHESWRRLYVREVGSFAALPFWARALAGMLLKYCDSQGRICVRPGEDVIEGVAMRLCSNSNERKPLRKYLSMLVDDGYAEVADSALRVRNFRQAQGGSITAEADPDDEPGASREPAGSQPGASRVPTEQQAGVSGAPDERQPGASRAPAGRADRVKSAESLDSDPAFLPSSLPSSEEELLPRDPSATEQEPKSAFDWYTCFQVRYLTRWGKHYGRGQADGEQISKLNTKLESLPAAERHADWNRRDEMVAAFFARTDERTRSAGWKFAFFVGAFDGLRLAAGATKDSDAAVGEGMRAELAKKYQGASQ
jgi:hypothetical protein